MWIRRTALEDVRGRCALQDPGCSRLGRSSGTGGLLPVAVAVLVATTLFPAGPAGAQPAATRAQPAGEELILTVTANGVPRGEFTLFRPADGDFWLLEQDLPRLGVSEGEGARRQALGQQWLSLRALGAALKFDEANLALGVDFPPQRIAGTTLNLSPRPQRVEITAAQNSLILSYRLSVRRIGASGGQPASQAFAMDADLNVRRGGLLLRQEMRVDTEAARRAIRGPTQAIWDDPRNARRYVAGDVVSSAGFYGSAITGAGVSLFKLYDITPDVITSPTMTVQASARLPAEVEVAVDGAPIYRATVGPGPITLNQLQLHGGSRDVRVTVTDASGRREVIEQPFLFTDSVLARGLHEYSYFLGKRSQLGSSNELQYREAAWQFFHRYGLTDSVTVGAGGEGSPEFASGGGGISLRSDRLGLISLDLLGSRDRAANRSASGWSARYTYLSPSGSFVLARREFGDGYRTFATGPLRTSGRGETRVGVATRVGRAAIAADFVRSEGSAERRDVLAVRLSTSISRRWTVLAEYQATRLNGLRDWSAFVFLRADLDRQHWVSSTARATSSLRSLDLETGREIDQGEGFGYRVGLGAEHSRAANTAYGFGALNYNARAAELSLFGTAPLRGAGPSYLEAGMAGALVGVDGSWGITRRVSDSFVLARLGVPQAGVEVAVNNQVQGRTDRRGELLIPQVGAFGRQDVTINDKQLGMQYNVRQIRRTIAPPFRSGTVVDFGGKQVRAVAGMAWTLANGRRSPIRSRVWDMAGPVALSIETASAGDFYLEDAPPGLYEGVLQVGDQRYSCRMSVPASDEPVQELKEGITCE